MGQCKIEDQRLGKSEHRGFKKAKERMLKKSFKPGAKTLRAIKLKENMGQASLRKEVLSKVLKKTLEARF
jgi:hypothetical protein